MKRYQLIGRKKVVGSRDPKIQYPLTHICSLPHEILIHVFSFLSQRDLICLATTCRRFKNIIYKHYLYKSITLTESSFSKFSSYHLRGSIKSSSLTKKFRNTTGPSSCINYISSVQLINPPSSDAQKELTNITGTIDVESDYKRDSQTNYNEYIANLTSLFDNCFGLKSLRIVEISPSFKFSKDISVAPEHKSFWKKQLHTRTLNHLLLKPQSGWSIPFEWTMVSLFFRSFNNIIELELSNFVIDDSKLINFPISPNISLSTLTLDSGSYSDTLRKLNLPKKPSPLFSHVTTLKLINISHGSSLSLIDFIKQNNKLHNLVLDMDSSIFYQMSQGKREFQFAKYNPFFELLCSGTRGYSCLKSLTLVNFDLFDCLDHSSSQSDVDSWVEPPKDTFTCFMDYISNIQYLTIVVKHRIIKETVCKKCGVSGSFNDKRIDTLTTEEWSSLLGPLLANSNRCNITIQDHKSNTIYCRWIEE